jgi:hypothetical protein
LDIFVLRLIAHDIASWATWARTYSDSNDRRHHSEARSDLFNEARYDRMPLSAGTPDERASVGGLAARTGPDQAAVAFGSLKRFA